MQKQERNVYYVLRNSAELMILLMSWAVMMGGIFAFLNNKQGKQTKGIDIIKQKDLYEHNRATKQSTILYRNVIGQRSR